MLHNNMGNYHSKAIVGYIDLQLGLIQNKVLHMFIIMPQHFTTILSTTIKLSAVACQRSEFPGNAASSDGVFGRRECHDVDGILLMAGLDLSRRCRWSYEGLVVVPGRG
ncbi:uncharacterized protein MEPE_01920 [Melanopsichium pennsylvanicum]|uniref:Uncharacterized protein n=1 Tax=Melanopsichium pennsylvanicum TaxID=63383 RepID=A0AAJ4XIH1_9BASI|nr:uncharacterized protein MEPE_01920 [Melanopsichium pennsylvanicum]